MRPSFIFSRWIIALIMLVGCILFAEDPIDSLLDSSESPSVPKEVLLEPKAGDASISSRLKRIFEATGWFEAIQIRVDDGVVFLSGKTSDFKFRQWADDLSQNTEGVVAVVNHLKVTQPAFWGLEALRNEALSLAEVLMRNIPLALLTIMLVGVTWLLAKWGMGGLIFILERKIHNQLLREIVARTLTIPVYLIGIYLVLRITGQTKLALTLIGGTGLFGLILGLSLKNIAENLIASILVSIDQPFSKEDLVLIGDHEGYVQGVNRRCTTLLTCEGNIIQIPNADVYKATIINYTMNPVTRFEFNVGIGYECSITEAQSLALSVAEEHSAVERDPIPTVLVESLGAATVKLRIVYWIDISKHSQLKVQSSLIRQLKLAYQAAKISMPDEARELIFPDGIHVQILEETVKEKKKDAARSCVDELEERTAEGELEPEINLIRRHAAGTDFSKGTENLLSEG